MIDRSRGVATISLNISECEVITCVKMVRRGYAAKLPQCNSFGRLILSNALKDISEHCLSERIAISRLD